MGMAQAQDTLSDLIFWAAAWLRRGGQSSSGPCSADQCLAQAQATCVPTHWMHWGLATQPCREREDRAKPSGPSHMLADSGSQDGTEPALSPVPSLHTLQPFVQMTSCASSSVSQHVLTPLRVQMAALRAHVHTGLKPCEQDPASPHYR